MTRKIEAVKSSQGSLLNLPSLCVDADIAASMARIVEGSGLSREQAVDRMNDAARRFGVRLCSGSAKALSLATFEKWLNPSADDNVPSTRALNLFCHVFGTVDPLDVLARSHGMGWRMVDGEEARVLDVALKKQKIEQLKAEIRRMEKN